MLATAESAVSDGIFIASNESVYGPGEKAQAAIVQSASRVERYPEAVSYTHLTLPTILLV